MSDHSSQDMTWIDAVASRFERAWKTGPRPQIEDFLTEAAESQRAPLLTELLRVERELRLKAGELPTAKEYRGRFPEHHAAVTAAFDRDPSAPSSTGRASIPRSAHTHDASDQPAAGPIPADLANHPDYEIVRRLGAGGMGVVYLAHNRLVGRDEVLKVMGQQISRQPGVSDRFLGEIRAVAKLRHANIVSFYTAFRCGESLIFAMEHVDGFDLARCIKAKGPFSVSYACACAHQAALGLQHAHEEGMVHRDIKPSNLMLSRKGKRPVIKLLDFGLARASREQGLIALSRDETPSPDRAHLRLTCTGEMLGTPDYIAPEQIVDAQAADIRADIYSLGCTLYCLLTGRPPFEGKLEDVLRAHRAMEAPLLDLVRPDVPPGLADLVAQMLAKTPDDRPRAPAEVAVALTPFFTAGSPSLKTWNLAGLPGTTQEPSPSPEQSSTQKIEPHDPSQTIQPDAWPLERGHAGSFEPFGSMGGAGSGVVVILPPKQRSRSLLTVSGVIGLAAMMLVGTFIYRAMGAKDAKDDSIAPTKTAANDDERGKSVDPPTTRQRPSKEQSPLEAPPLRKHDDKGQIAAATPPPEPKSKVDGPAPPAVAVSPKEEKTGPPLSAKNSKTPAAPAKRGSTPWEDALSTRGLTKTGTLYILDAEQQFLSGFAELEPLWVKRNRLYADAAPVVGSLQEYDVLERQEAEFVQARRNVRALQNAFQGGNDSASKQAWQDLLNQEAALDFQLNALDKELDFRWKNLMPESERERLFAEFQEAHERFLRESKNLRALGDKVSKRYAELRKDKTVTSAMKAMGLLNKDLGPSQEFNNKRKRLKEAEKVFSPATVSRKRTRSKDTKQGKGARSSRSAESSARPK